MKQLIDDTAELREQGHDRAIAIMRDCLTDHGFLATPTEQDNYRRIWGRDSSIIGLASLLTDDDELIDGCRRSLETLAHYQGPHGEIPSNVDPITERISYGGTAGDDAFLNRMLEPLEKTR